ncbi:leucine-rich repeat flightless-interacting protein 2 isoform X6 [Sinocyclocheilus anshuiensis]|uniref:leucine-rich repeat flightless-interacting protein 2 isoform X6 n=1 Tax=Sinocyclocheilus anshuiensis TaxID=1608454 RepID=UPI0007B7DB33|nr:PREDICTED: leucine-rich repeat flightless-interacting protein 2-like isoform X6 [Sinocyclocheilus anshuiensis]
MVLFDIYTTGQHFSLGRSFFCSGSCQSIREFKMATQVTGRKRIPNREKLSAEDDALSQIAREAEARLAAKRAARAEAREIRMKELERQQKEEDSERYSRHSRRHTSISDDEERMSVGSRGSLRGNHTDLCSSTSSLPSARLQNGRPSALFSEPPRSRSHRGSLHEESSYSATRRFSGSSARGPSDYNGFLGSSSRASSRASSARASPVVEERSDFLEKGSRTASTLSAATLASLGGGLSRRGSCDTSISADTEASIREMKDSLVEVEEKYRKAMVSNAQLDNEKTNLMYQVDTLRDTLMELEELLCEKHRECEEKTRDFEREHHAHNVLKFQFEETKETLKQSEELLTEAQQSRGKQTDYIREIADLQETLEWKDKKIRALERQKEYSDIIHDEREALRNEVCRLRDALKKHGIILGSEVTANGELADGAIDGHADAETASRLNQDSHTPTMSGDSMLEIRLRKLVEERESLLDQVRKYKAIAEQKQKNGTEETGSTDEDDLQNGLDPHILDLQRDANRQISDLKFKLVKSEQEVTALEQNIIRLEGQVSRYKTSAEAAEKVEDELKVEKRKLQRELRSALDRIDELEASNSHLTKRLEKMKANRSALLAQQ